MKQHLLAAALFLAGVGPAAAYTAYILPETFNPNDGDVAVQAAYANTFFTPAVGLPADMKLIYPDGFQGTFGRAAAGPTVTELSSDLPQWGTYRITTGELMGAVTTMIPGDGVWVPLPAGQAAPEGVETRTMQTVTLADSYMSRGAPTRGVVDQHIGTLALAPVTHPNEILVSQGFVVELRFEGAPAPNQPVVLYEAGDADTDQSTYFVTDAQGRATVTFTQPGQYVLTARRVDEAPAGAGVSARSYVTSLTFNVITAIPDYPEPPPVERQRERRRGLSR